MNDKYAAYVYANLDFLCLGLLITAHRDNPNFPVSENTDKPLRWWLAGLTLAATVADWTGRDVLGYVMQWPPGGGIVDEDHF